MLTFTNIIPCLLILTIIIQMDGDKMQVFTLQHGRKNCEIKNLKNIRVFDTVIHPEYKWDVLMSNISRDHLVVILSTNSFPIAYDSRIHGSITVLWRAYEYAASSLTMAIEAFCMENNYSLGTNFPGMDIVFLDDKCDPNVGIPNIIKMKEAGVDVIFGMPCSTVTIHAGYYLKHWNIPLISYASNDAVISDKNTYSTVIRMGAGYKQIGQAFVEILKNFSWNVVTILSRGYGLCNYGTEYINSEIKKQPGMTVAEYNIVEDQATDEHLATYLHNFKERARVLVVCLASSQMVRLMEIAYDLGMVNSEYVYLTFSLMPSDITLKPWGKTDGLDETAITKRREAFAHLKTLTNSDMTGEDKLDFMQEMADKMSEYPWYINTTKELGIGGSPYGLYLYDSMSFYLSVVNETMNEGLDPRNGTLIFERARNRIFHGISGEVIMDDVADRIPNYWLWQITPEDEEFYHFATLRMISEETERVNIINTPYWGTKDGQPPPDVPVCGYRYELCPPSTKARDSALIACFTCFAVISVLVFTGIGYYRRKKFELDIQKMSWKIDYEDIEFSTKRTRSMLGLSYKSMRSSLSGIPDRVSLQQSHNQSGDCVDQIFTRVGMYKGVICAIKAINKTDCKLSRLELIELKMVKDITHENINPFIGACIEKSTIFILGNYCQKGSLQDILEHDEIKLDNMFKYSLINDLITGLAYIHGSVLSSHGHLRSSNCLIDSRWVLKIGNVGLQSIKKLNVTQKHMGDYEKYKNSLWIAPEILRIDEQLRPLNGTQRGDIYSLGLILQEIIFRTLPYSLDELSPKEIVTKLRKHLDPPFRPTLPEKDKEVDHRLIELMQDCWSENPNRRPDLSSIKKVLTTINKGRKANILDNMVQKLEAYANNLEDIVEKRTEQLVDEKKKTDILLYRMLPRPIIGQVNISVVAERLKNGQVVAPEMYDSVSIYFSDVVGFTSISAASEPMQVVDLLNDLYTLFDDVICKYDVYKVETIGDAYMCVSGCPNRNSQRHASEIANMSLSLRDNVRKFKISHLPDRALMIRIGVHTGPCAAGVVGLTMPRYCLFGDTVNVASRMESNGEAMKIHVSDETFKLLNNICEYSITCRGQVELKGKGLVTTYWLDKAVATTINIAD